MANIIDSKTGTVIAPKTKRLMTLNLKAIDRAHTTEGDRRVYLMFEEPSGARHMLGIGIDDLNQRLIGERELCRAYPDLREVKSPLMELVRNPEKYSQIPVRGYLEDQDKINPKTGKPFTNLRLEVVVKNPSKLDDWAEFLGESLDDKPETILKTTKRLDDKTAPAPGDNKKGF